MMPNEINVYLDHTRCKICTMLFLLQRYMIHFFHENVVYGIDLLNELNENIEFEMQLNF